MAFSKHFSCFSKELKAKLSHETGNLECYLGLTWGCCSREQLSPYHTEKDFELQSLTLGEPMGSEGCVMYLPNPFVLMTSLVSKVQQGYASSSVSELICVELVATFGVATGILSVSTVLMDPQLWEGTLCFRKSEFY